MLSHPCPSCGQPALLDLAHPTVLECESCEGSSELPQALQAQLKAGQQVLDGLRAKDRQLGGLRAALVGGGGCLVAVYLFMAVPFVGGFTLAALGALTSSATGGNSPMHLALTSGQLCGALLMVAVTALAVRRLLSLRRRLQLAAAARPPSRPGAPARCHVCAAPVPVTAARVARCAHCDADNVVDPKVLALVAAQGREDLDDLEEHLRTQASAVALAAGGSALAGVGCTLAAPFGCGVPLSLTLVMGVSLFQVAKIMFAGGMGPADSNRYQVVRTVQGDCLGWLNPHPDGERLLLEPEVEYRATARVLKPEDLAKGVVVLDRVSGLSGPIKRLGGGVFYTSEDMNPRTGPDTLTFMGPDGARVSTDAHSVCLVE